MPPPRRKITLPPQEVPRYGMPSRDSSPLTRENMARSDLFGSDPYGYDLGPSLDQLTPEQRALLTDQIARSLQLSPPLNPDEQARMDQTSAPGPLRRRMNDALAPRPRAPGGTGDASMNMFAGALGRGAPAATPSPMGAPPAGGPGPLRSRISDALAVPKPSGGLFGSRAMFGEALGQPAPLPVEEADAPGPVAMEQIGGFLRKLGLMPQPLGGEQGLPVEEAEGIPIPTVEAEGRPIPTETFLRPPMRPRTPAMAPPPRRPPMSRPPLTGGIAGAAQAPSKFSLFERYSHPRLMQSPGLGFESRVRPDPQQMPEGTAAPFDPSSMGSAAKIAPTPIGDQKVKAKWRPEPFAPTKGLSGNMNTQADRLRSGTLADKFDSDFMRLFEKKKKKTF